MRWALLFVLLTSSLAGCADDPINLAPEPVPQLIVAPENVVEALERAYRAQDDELLVQLLANEPGRNAEFLFLLSELMEDGTDQWGYNTEARVHRRMFRPQDALGLPVHEDLWLESVDVTLTPLTNFAERPDLYSEDRGADGKLDPNVWRATSALYSANVFFGMKGPTSYQVDGQADFVVIEDLAKVDGEAGRFLLFIWEDIPIEGRVSKPGDEVATSGVSWSRVKELFL